MRYIALILFLLLGQNPTVQPHAHPEESANKPSVVVELFTSEGCSSCPPADQLLIELSENGPDGIEVLALSQHVDYWDRLGWKDPFSSPVFTARQRGYSGRMGLSTMYTPQVVVDGVEEMVGSDRSKVIRAIQRAATRRKHSLLLEVRSGGSKAEIRASIPSLPQPPKGADWVIAIVESGLATEVESGENQGRRLPHTGVVRVWKYYRSSELGTQKSVQLAPDWQKRNLAVVSFVQERKSGRILAATRESF